MLRPVWPEFFQSLRASCLTTESRPFFYCSVCEPRPATPGPSAPIVPPLKQSTELFISALFAPNVCCKWRKSGLRGVMLSVGSEANFS